MRKSFSKYLLVFLTLIVGSELRAEIYEKPPRVAELEESLSREASQVVRTRFPDLPFLVTVAVDPIRRIPGGGYKKEIEEQLPYLDLQDEEIRDEWDNPNLTLNQLMLRVRKISLVISVPNSVRTEELSELKESIFSSLHLTPMRDEVQIFKKDWAVQALPGWVLWGSGVVVIFSLLMLLALFAMIRSSNRAPQPAAVAKEAAQAPVPISVQVTAPAAPAIESVPRSIGSAGEVTLRDPIKIRKMMSEQISLLKESSVFPTLRSLMVLDEYGKTNPSGLGAILNEFPLETRNQLLAYSTGEWWFDAMNAIPSPSLEAVEILRRMNFENARKTSKKMEDLMIAIWRLGDKRVEFLRELDRDIAFSILALLPKAISIATARKAFPGNWGQLLDPKAQTVKLPEEELGKWTKHALELQPLTELALFENYRQEVELKEYLNTVDLSEERDIYGASPPDAMIHRLRPPFFQVLDQNDEILAELVPIFSPEQWALALAGVTPAEYRKITKNFNERQKAFFEEQIKEDESEVEHRQMIQIRQQMAKELRQLLHQKASASETGGVREAA